MEDRTRDLIDYAILALSFCLLLVAILGEALGWWGDLGIVLSLASLVGALSAALDIYGRRGVSLLGAVVGNQEAMLSNQEAMLGNQEAMLGNQDASMRRLDEVQDLLDERLPEGT